MAVELKTNIEVVTPKFRDPSELSYEQLTDPDYRMKQIAREAGISEYTMLVCSKCHHCRR